MRLPKFVQNSKIIHEIVYLIANRIQMMKHKETLLIVDGHNLLFQMFYGMPSRIVNREGKAIQGVIGFVGALIKIIKQTQPTHLVVLFDGEHENPRTELLPEYKENRMDYSLVEEAENPFSQLEDVYRALDYMGIRHGETTEVETDDVIASYALTYGTKMPVVIASWDSDFFQLITEKVSVLRYRGTCTTLCDKSYLAEKFGITPDLYADFKALVGDKADNIKGAEKIGPKTAESLLHRYGSLEEIIAHGTEIERRAVRESVLKNEQVLRVNYEIIKLNDSAPVPFAIHELEYTYDNCKTNDILRGIDLL